MSGEGAVKWSEVGHLTWLIGCFIEGGFTGGGGTLVVTLTLNWKFKYSYIVIQDLFTLHVPFLDI